MTQHRNRQLDSVALGSPMCVEATDLASELQWVPFETPTRSTSREVFLPTLPWQPMPGLPGYLESSALSPDEVAQG